MLRITHPDDESVRIRLDGKDVISCNHDEHGWAGIEIAVQTARKLAELAGWQITDG